MRLPGKVGKRVYALAYEMEPLGFPLTIQLLELNTPLEEEFVCEYQLLS